MQSNFSKCLAFTFQEEGGFVNNPADPGGATNLGITIETLSDWLGRHAAVQDVRDLTRDVATKIYEREYWGPTGGLLLPAGLDLMAFDFGVNAGAGTSVKRLQALLRVRQDGDVGTETMDAIKTHDLPWLITTLGMAQSAFYRADGEPDFIAGQLARTKRRQSLALSMAAAA